MPSMSNIKLTSVAGEYLRNFEDLEAARTIFLDERAKVLDSRDDAYGAYDVNIDAKYVAVRERDGDKRKSGYSTAVGAYLGHVGAQTLLWFQLKVTPSRKNALEISALERELGLHIEVLGEGGWLYVRSGVQAATELDLDALGDDARRLPKMFATADAWIAQRWRG